jgi:hypothetical protein
MFKAIENSVELSAVKIHIKLATKSDPTTKMRFAQSDATIAAMGIGQTISGLWVFFGRFTSPKTVRGFA